MDPNNTTDHTLPPVDDTASVVDGNDEPTTETGAGSVQPIPVPPQPASTVMYSDDQSQLNAEDVDLIEKAWVQKAKAIVQDTQGDPYTQNKELSKVKADYIKKRYNRDIKVNS